MITSSPNILKIAIAVTCLVAGNLPSFADGPEEFPLNRYDVIWKKKPFSKKEDPPPPPPPPPHVGKLDGWSLAGFTQIGGEYFVDLITDDQEIVTVSSSQPYEGIKLVEVLGERLEDYRVRLEVDGKREVLGFNPERLKANPPSPRKTIAKSKAKELAAKAASSTNYPSKAYTKAYKKAVKTGTIAPSDTKSAKSGTAKSSSTTITRLPKRSESQRNSNQRRRVIAPKLNR